jgi:hypothetical protein
MPATDIYDKQWSNGVKALIRAAKSTLVDPKW